jgi:hypothetical protein
MDSDMLCLLSCDNNEGIFDSPEKIGFDGEQTGFC